MMAEQQPATTESSAPVNPEPKGIGGWLLIPAIGLVWAPIAASFGLFQGISTIHSFTPELIRDSRLWLIVLLDAVPIIASIVVAVLFFGKRRIAVPAFIGLMVAFIVVAAIQVPLQAWLQAAISGESEADWSWVGLRRPCVFAAVWIPYFLISKRVKNTFTR